MASVTIELPPHAAQTELNLRRWTELLNDPELAKVEGRIETDRHGKEKMTLYFDSRANEVWVCSESGRMQFFDKTLSDLGESKLCPGFPKRIDLR